MDWTNIALIVAGVLAGILLRDLPAALWKRTESPTGEYEIWVDTISREAIRSGDLRNADARFLVRGVEVLDPYIVDIFLWSAGSKDIPQSAFDGGQPFTVDFGCPVHHWEEIGSKGSLSITQAEGTDSAGKLALNPGLVRTGDGLHYRFISSGAPRVRIQNPVVDLQHSSLRHAWNTKTPRQTWLARLSKALIILGFVGFGAVFVVPTFVEVDFGLFTGFAAITSFGMMLFGVALVGQAEQLDGRASKADMVLRESLNVEFKERASREALLAPRPSSDSGPKN